MVFMLRIALAQINTTVGDFDGNMRKMLLFAEKAAARHADFVLFPELALPGYPPEDLLLNRSFIDANRRYLRKLAALAPDVGIICGYAGSQGKEVYNSAGIISDGKLRYSYNKIYLPNYGVFDEKRYFQPGSVVPVLSLDDIRIGVNVCEDIWVHPGLCGFQAAWGARLILNISSSPYHLHKLDERTRLLQGQARLNRCYIAYVNTVGGQDELVFDGGSLVVDPRGKVIARAGQFVEQLLLVDFSESALIGKGLSAIRGGECPDSFKVEQVALRRKPRTAKNRRVRNTVLPRLGDVEEIYTALVIGTRDYIDKNRFKKVIIGLSGGVDSALTLAIVVDAIGSSNVDALFMPSRFTSDISRHASVKQGKLLGVRLHEIPIDDLFAAYIRELKPHFGNLPEDITEENIQARIRGNLLMAFSNKFGHLVVNTANKSEAAVGYSTLYGDMVGGFAVLKDIPKTMVYKLCRYLNRSRKREIIAREIIRRPPSAELKADQLDSDSLPPYDILDKILKAFVEEDRNAEEIVKMGFDRKLVARVIRMVVRAEYKRRQMAPGIKITPRAFGKDRRWPITNKF